jgi:hypothetical protein
MTVMIRIIIGIEIMMANIDCYDIRHCEKGGKAGADLSQKSGTFPLFLLQGVVSNSNHIGFIRDSAYMTRSIESKHSSKC